MTVTIVRELLNPEDSPTGHGLYYNESNTLLFVGSRCCNYPLNRDVYAGGTAGYDVYRCMKCGFGLVESYYMTSVDIGVDPEIADPGNPWTLNKWAESWTGITGIEVNIVYM